MRQRIADIDAHRLVPAIGNAAQPRIQRRAQFRDQVGQRIGKIFVFAAPKTVTPHHDAAAEFAVVRIQRGDRPAFVGRQQPFQHGAALPVEIGGHLRPVDGIDAGGDVGGWAGVGGFCGCFHGRQFRKSGSLEPPDFR